MKLIDIWSQVPKDYFSKGVKGNILQYIWHTGKLNAISKTLSGKKVGTLIDIGSADGSLISRLSRQHDSYKVILATDPYFPPLSFGSKHFPDIRYIQSDAQHIPVKQNSIDTATIFETLEHVVDPYCTLMELKRIIKKSGRIIVELDSGSFLFQIIWFFWKKLGRGKVWNHAHLTYFNVHLLEQLFQNAGLSVEEKITFNLGMGVCFVLRK